MTESAALTLVPTSEVKTYRQLFLDIHVEVRTEVGLMQDPFNAVDLFDERLTRYASRGGWEAIIGYNGEEPVGYVFGVPLGPGSVWWSSMRQLPPEDFTWETGSRTFAVNEILVRKRWRGTAGQAHPAYCTSRFSPSAWRNARRFWSIPLAPTGD
ncbi:hypothetical protein [Streptomyces malaysiensis]|uniref:hypothetical protein n=1 Tax=Streptomyces malaysiensis TaxID=92644 RepID=UPI00202E4A20|nr:hypothetical protein [Streptomyces malaysiensis]